MREGVNNEPTELTGATNSVFSDPNGSIREVKLRTHTFDSHGDMNIDRIRNMGYPDFLSHELCGSALVWYTHMN